MPPVGDADMLLGIDVRFLGVWLVLACFAYLALSLTGLLFPAYEEQVNDIATPRFLGEVATMLWLLIMGAREKSLSV